MGFKLKGLVDFKTSAQNIKVNMPEELGSAIYQESQIEMTEAKKRTPVWNPANPVPPGHTPGSLRASGTVHEPEQHGDRVSCDLTFGDEIVDYAVYVHEDLEANHATGQAKFLQSVLEESAPYMDQRIARRIDLKKVVG